MTSRIIVISGIQASGKTTVARLVAARFERGVHIEVDALQRMIVTGGVWPGEPGLLHAAALSQLRLRLHNACILAKSFHEACFTPVIDDIIVGERLDHLKEELAGIPFQLVILAPDVTTVIDRDKEREKTVGAEWAHYLDAELRQMPRDVGLWVDSTSQSPEETADEILRRLSVTG